MYFIVFFKLFPLIRVWGQFDKDQTQWASFHLYEVSMHLRIGTKIKLNRKKANMMILQRKRMN